MNDLLNTGCPKGADWGSGCIIIRDNKILLGLRTDNNLWGSPGGRIEEGETPIEGVKREVLEETGLIVHSADFVGCAYSLNEKTIWKSFVFVCRSFSGELKAQESEVAELKWVAINDLGEYNLFTPTKESMSMILQMHPDYLYPEITKVNELALDDVVLKSIQDVENIEKLTSLEQLIDVKNPGRNGGHGGIGSDGNWQYTKPGSKSNYSEKLRRLQERRNPGVTVSESSSKQIQELRNSYIQYFQNKEDFEQIYKVQDGKFVFPECSNAIADGIVKDKKSYMTLFKEQYMHFILSNNK